MDLYLIPTAFVLDLILGDPRIFPHPIRWMGKGILLFEPKFRRLPLPLVINGAFFTFFLVGLTYLLCKLIIVGCYTFHPVAGDIMTIILIYYALAIRSLYQAAIEIFNTLNQQGLEPAKAKLRLIVGRDVTSLTDKGVHMATIETVAENFVDGIMTPLFFAAIGGAPLAMAFKMVNTLDSMVGYKNETYIQFGKCAARLDDLCNFIPARLSVLVISLATEIIKQNGKQVLKIGYSEGKNHASPNAGFPEAAFAGALNVKLGGPNYYHGRYVPKPYLGQPFNEPQRKHIQIAGALMLASTFLWIILLWTVAFLLFLL